MSYYAICLQLCYIYNYMYEHMPGMCAGNPAVLVGASKMTFADSHVFYDHQTCQGRSACSTTAGFTCEPERMQRPVVQHQANSMFYLDVVALVAHCNGCNDNAVRFGLTSHGELHRKPRRSHQQQSLHHHHCDAARLNRLDNLAVDTLRVHV